MTDTCHPIIPTFGLVAKTTVVGHTNLPAVINHSDTAIC